MKTAYIFPGQGSQFPGMAKDLYDSSADVRALFSTAESILGFNISEVMFEGSEDDLKQTAVTQPAIFIHSIALVRSIGGFRPDMVAGHSLGEFSALAAAGAMSFEDGLRLVDLRARQMQLCCEKSDGMMAAVIGMEDSAVESVCSGTDGIVVAANYNCNGQIVISGEREAVMKACGKLKEAGAKRALPLQVSGAFHSPLMEPAAMELGKAIDLTAFTTPVCPVYQNVTGRAETDPETIKANLLAQLNSPVKWTASVKQMLEDGASRFVELGPGSVLQGLVKRIAKAEGFEVAIEGIQ